MSEWISYGLQLVPFGIVTCALIYLLAWKFAQKNRNSVTKTRILCLFRRINSSLVVHEQRTSATCPHFILYIVNTIDLLYRTGWNPTDQNWQKQRDYASGSPCVFDPAIVLKNNRYPQQLTETQLRITNSVSVRARRVRKYRPRHAAAACSTHFRRWDMLQEEGA